MACSSSRQGWQLWVLSHWVVNQGQDGKTAQISLDDQVCAVTTRPCFFEAAHNPLCYHTEETGVEGDG